MPPSRIKRSNSSPTLLNLSNDHKSILQAICKMWGISMTKFVEISIEKASQDVAKELFDAEKKDGQETEGRQEEVQVD
jgi:hypothetical protein